MTDGSHLGGWAFYDQRSFVPDVWRLLIDKFDVKLAMDIGAGSGFVAGYLTAQMGVPCIAVEGDPGMFNLGLVQNSLIAVHDYSEGPLPAVAFPDMVLSTEFVEHVEEAYTENYLQDFARARKCLAMTYAKPGDAGHHHVNMKEEPYWVQKVEAATGMVFDEGLTQECRALHPDVYKFFHGTGLVFVRR